MTKTKATKTKATKAETETPQLSDRIDSVCHALSAALDMAEEIKPDLKDRRPTIHITTQAGVVIMQNDDPADALLLDEEGLTGLTEGSMYIPWSEGQDSAFFAAFILTFILTGEILTPPQCAQCAAEMAGD